MNVYIGTYSCNLLFGTGEIFEGKGEGIYRYHLNENTGEMTFKSLARGVDNPSYLAVDQKRKMLYAVNELEKFEGKDEGAVSSFRLTDDSMEFVNTQPTKGQDPCHVAILPNGRHICVSNYMTGSECIYPIMENGEIGEIVQFMQHQGCGGNPDRQEGPHCHATTFSPDGRFAFVVELGTDRLLCYKVQKEEPYFVPAEIPEFRTVPGAGPRVCLFHPFGKKAYLANELNNTILVLDYDMETGSFTQIQCISTLPETADAKECTFADIHMTPDGKYLYGTNRGHNSIVVFEADKESGMLTCKGWQSCGGKTPRNFAIDPTGRYLLCANQDSDSVVVFSIDARNGNLEKKNELSIGSPVCIRILQE